VNARQKKKIVELYQGETLGKTELNVLLLSSAILLSFLVFVQVDFLNTKNFVFSSFAFLLGILISLVNIGAWKNLVKGFSMSEKPILNFLHFFIQKTVVILCSLTMALLANSSFFVSVLLGFSLHIGVSILLIMPYAAFKERLA